MRLELAGTLIRPDPIVLTFTEADDFLPASYIEEGYTNFDVICIGAGGGMGGGINTGNTGTQIRSFGGAGGGGGLHRVQGLLSALPASCPVVVGAGGNPGAEHGSDPAMTTNGQDGGYSSFNDTTCQASGGKGGKRVQANSQTVTSQADGGEGGIGGRLIAGGGGAGGVAGTPTATGPGTPGTPGADGTWNGTIGAGGGGGAGGVAKFGSGGVTLNAATAGGRGSYNTSDTAVYSPGGPPTDDTTTGATDVMPGEAGGGKATPLSGLPTVFGQSNGKLLPGKPGAVVVRLTAS